MSPPLSMRGRLSWLGHDLTVAAPDPVWFSWLEDFTGLAVRTEEADPSGCRAAPPVLSVVDDRHALVDGNDLRSFSSLNNLKAWLFLTVSDVMIERGGFTAFHAAGFIVDGRAVLVSGRPWAGKSSWAFAAAERGLDVLGDDQVLVDAAVGLVYGLPRPMKRRIISGAETTSSPSAAVRASLDDEEIVLVPRRTAGLAPVDRGYPVSQIVHLSRHRGPGIVPISLDSFTVIRTVLDQMRGRPSAFLRQTAAAARMLSRLRNSGLSVGDGEIARGLDAVLDSVHHGGDESRLRTHQG